MIKENTVLRSYEIAKERYAEYGVDTDAALALLGKTPISIQCWQADDVVGFERGESLSGGIQTTGNYPGKARNIDELRADIAEVRSLVGGTLRLNLHATYGDFAGEKTERNEIEPRHFASWIDWSREMDMKLDFNSTSFSHPLSGTLSLANPDPAVRAFWIEHTERCRRIAEEFGKAQGDPCIMNIWVHDGSKDLTVERLRYRKILAEALDEILSENLPHMKTCLEAKLFGIGLESYTVGSHDFVGGYCATRQLMYTLDTGHYEMTENVSDLAASLLLFVPELMLHVSRPVRWDSDHVAILNDSTLDLFKEIIRADALGRVHIGLDYFDASIDRIGAYLVGIRATQKALLSALLEPLPLLRAYEDRGQYFQRLSLLEEEKTLPMGAVYDMFNLQSGVPVGSDAVPEVERYFREVSSRRI